MTCVSVMLSILLVLSVAYGAMRERLTDEIVPISAVQSRTWDGDEEQYGPSNAIDLDLDTRSRSARGTDGAPWLKLSFNQVYCVYRVVEYNRVGSAWRTWTCSGADCVGYECSLLTLTVSTERSTPGALPAVPDCVYGDTVKLQDSYSLWVWEMSVQAKPDCKTLDSSWDHVKTIPVLPVRYGASLTVTCPAGSVQLGSNKATCQNGVLVPSVTPPQCSFPKCKTLDQTWSQVETEPALPVLDEVKVTLTCQAGYVNKGGDKATCRNGLIVPTSTPPLCFLIVNGGWSDFESWSDCSTECGGGIRSRSRSCTAPVPQHGGRYCAGAAFESEICNSDPCSVPVCPNAQENDPMYGNYSWPTTLAGVRAEMNCVYNEEEFAYKECVSAPVFGPTVFDNCSSKVREEISEIRARAQRIADEEEQKLVSGDLSEVAERDSSAMNSDDVKTTSAIIDKVIEFDNNKTLGEEVRGGLLKTVDGIHRNTEVKELERKDAAASIRRSVGKLTKRISKDSEDNGSGPVFLREETVGVVVSKTTGNDTVFTVSGDETNFTKTGLDQNDQPVLLSVKVPADNKKRAVTAVLYSTPKFYPENSTVEDFSASLAAQFTGRKPNGTKRTYSKVVSMVTDIKYAETTDRIEFEHGQKIMIKYSVKGETPRAHYKMNLRHSYECVFYDTDKKDWVTGPSSGCDTVEETGRNGEKLVSCQCSHMTSFAVLMSFHSDYDPLEAKVTLILLGVSLWCLFFTIIAYLPAKELLRTRSVRINLLLVSSLMFSVIVFYFMERVVATNVQENDVPLEANTASTPCTTVAFLMNYFWLCQMAWMVCEAVVMYRALVSAVMDSHIHRYMLKFNLACWGAPLIFPIIGIIWGKTDYANPRTCFLRRKYGLVTFYIPVIACILFNIFLFIRIAWSVFRKQETGHNLTNELQRRKKQFKFAITVMTLLGVAWILGFFLIIQETNTLWLRWLFIVFNSTQGMMIFVLYVLLKDEVKKVWRKLLRSCNSNSHPRPNVPTSRPKGPITQQRCTATSSKSLPEVKPLITAAVPTRPTVPEVPEVPEIELSTFSSDQPSSSLITDPLRQFHKKGSSDLEMCIYMTM